jgi:hypothetical protein
MVSVKLYYIAQAASFMALAATAHVVGVETLLAAWQPHIATLVNILATLVLLWFLLFFGPQLLIARCNSGETTGAKQVYRVFGEHSLPMLAQLAARIAGYNSSSDGSLQKWTGIMRDLDITLKGMEEDVEDMKCSTKFHEKAFATLYSPYLQLAIHSLRESMSEDDDECDDDDGGHAEEGGSSATSADHTPATTASVATPATTASAATPATTASAATTATTASVERACTPSDSVPAAGRGAVPRGPCPPPACPQVASRGRQAKPTVGTAEPVSSTNSGATTPGKRESGAQTAASNPNVPQWLKIQVNVSNNSQFIHSGNKIGHGNSSEKPETPVTASITYDTDDDDDESRSIQQRMSPPGFRTATSDETFVTPTSSHDGTTGTSGTDENVETTPERTCETADMDHTRRTGLRSVRDAEPGKRVWLYCFRVPCDTCVCWSP